MGRPDLTLLPLGEALSRLSRWIQPHIPLKLLHPHEKISDADLVAVALLQRLHKIPYFSCWWAFLKVNHFPEYPSEARARVRLTRLTLVIEQLATEIQELDFATVDSQLLPVATFKRAPRCKFPGVRFGFSTAEPVFGFKLRAWSALNGRIVRYEIRGADQHDLTVLCEMNRDWPAYGGPKLIGDKGYQSGTVLTPAKVNANTVDPRWKAEYGAARKCIESAFSVLTGTGIRCGQVQTFISLRLKVATIILAHNLKFIDLPT